MFWILNDSLVLWLFAKFSWYRRHRVYDLITVSLKCRVVHIENWYSFCAITSFCYQNVCFLLHWVLVISFFHTRALSALVFLILNLYYLFILHIVKICLNYHNSGHEIQTQPWIPGRLMRPALRNLFEYM